MTETNDCRYAWVGACFDPSAGTRFRVWAPKAESVSVFLDDDRRVELLPHESGYFEVTVPTVGPGHRYFYEIDGRDRYPDPASRFQPEGVHGPSEVVSRSFDWTDDGWVPPLWSEWVIYELHVGTFTKEGTFDAVIRELPRLKRLGVTTIELMPVAQCPGRRNWGYDGVYPFAVQDSYGGPMALKKLINACHSEGLAIILDVVYNHLGPEGNYLNRFGPYFQSRYRTPWGDAINFDGPGSDEVREYYLQNARQWLEEFRFDGLRLDAIQTICDLSPVPFLVDLSRLKRGIEERVGRAKMIIAETDTNDSRTLESIDCGGLGLDGQWSDDLHHCLHATLTGESSGHYRDYGSLDLLAEVYRNGVAYHGQYSEFRDRRHGRSYDTVDWRRLVVCLQNHDQIGNRALGERVTTLVGLDQRRLAAACVFLSPFMPLLFMGEEYGEMAPFLYFVDHSDPDLIAAVRKGRKEEFQHGKQPPDPESEETYLKSKLRREAAPDATREEAFYQELIAISKRLRQEKVFQREGVEVVADPRSRLLQIRSNRESGDVRVVFSFSREPARVDLQEGTYKILFSTTESLQSGDQVSGSVEMRGYSAVLMIAHLEEEQKR